MAHSMASLVPEPIEKCAEALASPSSTMLPCDQFRQKIRGKRRQVERLRSRPWPCSSSAYIASRTRRGPSSSASVKPWPCQQASSISNTQVERPGSYW